MSVEFYAKVRVTPEGERIAYIHTSDRTTFRSCRRRWGWTSPLRGYRESNSPAMPLWFGTGFHYAMEDFHGMQTYGSAFEAFMAYVYACRNTRGIKLPTEWREGIELAEGMLGYYEHDWLDGRDPLTTYVDPNSGIPACEVRFEIPLPIESPHYDRVIYRGTIDRVAVDEHNRLWPIDFKSYASFDTLHFETDPQITAYCWACWCIYQQDIGGFLFQQHRKVIPGGPRILVSGKISIAENQLTSHRLYRRELVNLYGSVDKAPQENVDYLNMLTEKEGSETDSFIRRDRTERNQHQIEAEGQKILMEVEEMLNPDLALYPAPNSRQCGWCPTNAACIAMDDGGDWEQILEETTRIRAEGNDSWRSNLPDPETLQADLNL